MANSRFVLLLSVLSICGCRVEPPVGVDIKSQAAKQPAPKAAPAIPPNSDVVEPDSSEESASSTEAVIAPDEFTEASLPEPRERLLLLPATGPLIVDLILTVEGEAHQDALDRIVRDELAAADLNRDGTTWWREVANTSQFRYGEFRYNPDRSMRMFDGDGDGIADPNELLRFLTQNVGPTRSFVLRTSNDYRYDSDSRVRRLLDDDGNRTLAPEEIESATERLLNLDLDDDEVLMQTDFAGRRQMPSSTLLPKRRSDQPEVAVRIHDRTEWSYAWFSLSELYASGGPLTAEVLSSTTDLASLDVDQDGEIDESELKGMVDIAPDIVLAVSFGREKTSADPARPDLRLRRLSKRMRGLGAKVNRHAGRLSLSLPGAQLQFFVNEDPMLFNADVQAIDSDRDGKIAEYELASFMTRRQGAFRGLVRAWVAGHPDALYAALDEDGDGILKSREIHGATERIHSLDQDGDGQLRQSELPDSLVVGFVRGNPSQDSDLFANPAPPSTSDPSHPEWFTAMDANRDGEISNREFLGTSKQFQTLDDDADGYIAPGEAKMASL